MSREDTKVKQEISPVNTEVKDAPTAAAPWKRNQAQLAWSDDEGIRKQYLLSRRIRRPWILRIQYYGPRVHNDYHNNTKYFILI